MSFDPISLLNNFDLNAQIQALLQQKQPVNEASTADQKQEEVVEKQEELVETSQQETTLPQVANENLKTHLTTPHTALIEAQLKKAFAQKVESEGQSEIEDDVEELHVQDTSSDEAIAQEIAKEEVLQPKVEEQKPSASKVEKSTHKNKSKKADKQSKKEKSHKSDKSHKNKSHHSHNKHHHHHKKSKNK